MFYFTKANGDSVYGLPSHVMVVKRDSDGNTTEWDSNCGASERHIMEVEFVQADGDELDFALALLGLPYVGGKRVRTFVGDQARTIAANL